MARTPAEPSVSAFTRLRTWLNFGIDVNQPGYKQRINLIEQQFAEDNLRIMPNVCIGACIIMLLIMTSRCVMHGWELLNWVPFVIGILISAACAIQARRSQNEPATWMSIALVNTLSVCWYILAIYTNIVLQPDKPSVIMCLMFMAVPLLFDAIPARNLSMTLFAFVLMVCAESALGYPSVKHTDLNNALIAVFIGLGCSRMKTVSKVTSLMYLSMFQTATKTTEVVAQVDLPHDTFRVLQSPDSLAFLLRGKTSAGAVVASIADTFISPKWSERFVAFLDPKTLAERMGDTKQLTFEYQNADDAWQQLTIVEEQRVEGMVSAVVAVVRDIDAEKRTELAYQQQLREAVTDAERANASKSNFLRRMSHDIRTPINGIRGITQIAERFPDDAAKQRDCRQKVLEASNYLLMLVNNVLDMSKLESGAVELEHKPFCMSEILSEVSTLANMQANEHGVLFLLDNEGGAIEHDHLIGSPVHLRQVLHNLVSNGIKYNKEGGSVIVRCAEVADGGKKAQFRIIVQDTGIGMSEAFIEHAFDPFTQEEQAQSRTTYTGSGLGLSIVKEFTELMGGNVTLSSALGVGTQFTLTIPFEIDQAVHEQAPESHQTIDVAGKRALVAEDNGLNREIAEFVLKDIGLEVTLAKDGKEAVKAFAQAEPGTFDVVFMDIMMPVMDGLEAASAIRALDREDAKAVPIFAMTANAFQDDITRSQEAGMNAHLTKPLELDKIVAALQEWLPR